jgi:cation diffusion facilitator CzcD-associated flavoprotein CzcO
METHEVAIVGAGFSGLGMAIRLKEAGMDDFVVLERGEDVGGTWNYNTYPGCGCDVPSHLYSFSFAPNPDWTRTYSRQQEIHDYLRKTADEFGVMSKVRLGCTVESAEWNEDTKQWELQTSEGTIAARALVSGAGPLTEPKIPELPGLESFEGHTMHSARWDHDYDLTGKRVASVGTGASAIQYVPAIQPDVEQLHVFQRTPPWIFPHTDRATTRFERRLYKLIPAAQRLVRAAIYSGRETNVVAFVKNPKLMKIAELLARRHQRKQIKDSRLLEKVTPDYTIGCKRILPSNKWYPALQQPNVELVTGGVKAVTPTGVIGEDGLERAADVIIFGTGFEVADMPVAKVVIGRDGHSLHKHWDGSPKAYLGTAVHGFPNFFMLLGPNTGLGHNSMVYMIESQIAHVLGALKQLKQSGAETVEVSAEAAERFNEDIDERHEGAVWNTGCASWYLDDTGRNGTIWPDWTFRFRQRTAEFDQSDYVLAGARETQREAVAA